MPRTWAETQAAFAAALLDASVAPPAGVIECTGCAARGGFSVYRNNWLVGLIDALAERFPVTSRLVGEEFFRAMARSYAIGRRPSSPLLLEYGDDFPAFIEDFAPAGKVPYLSDVARLEAAWSEAYHAAEGEALEPHVLADIPPAALLESPLTLHPSIRILRCAHPVAQIWAAHQSADAATALKSWNAEDVLVVRPEADVHVHTLGAGVYAFLRALLDRSRIQDAAEIALSEHPDFDAGSSLVNLFGIGAVVALDAADTQEIRK